MRIIVNPLDEMAWKRVLRLYNKIGEATAEKIWKYLQSKQSPLIAMLSEDLLKGITKSALQGIVNCQWTFKRLIQSMAGASPSRIIQIVLDNGYRDYLQGRYTDAASREDDLEQLSNFSTKYHSLEDFVGEMALMTNISETNEEDLDDMNGNKIILSTIHQAKGLEWSVVLMIWCSDGMMPLARALKDPDGEEEERRLFYVAMTRAKDQLYLCYPVRSYTRGAGQIAQGPSRFIRELAQSPEYGKACPYDQWIVDEDIRFY